MKRDFSAFAKKGFVLLDGGFGTELQKQGLPGGVAPESLNLSDPERVKDIHRAYARAGADVICSNTFGANRRKHTCSGEAAALTAAGVRLGDLVSVSYRSESRTGRPMARMAMMMVDVVPEDETFSDTVTMEWEIL